MKHVAFGILGFIALTGFGSAIYSMRPPAQTSRLICKSAGQPEEMGRGVIEYSGGVYRFSKGGKIAVYDKSLFEACVIVPDEG